MEFYFCFSCKQYDTYSLSIITTRIVLHLVRSESDASSHSKFVLSRYAFVNIKMMLSFGLKQFLALKILKTHTAKSNTETV